MEIQPVMSKHVAGVGYDPATQELQIAFSTGSNYVYQGVPQETYDALMQAESVGGYHALNIRSRFPFQKVNQDAQQ